MQELYNNDTIYQLNQSTEIGFGEGLQSGKLWICYSQQDSEKVRGKTRELLINILKAAGYTGQNAYLVNLSKPVNFNLLSKENSFDKIIFFNCTPKWLSLQISPQKYKIYTLNRVQCLFADELDALQMNKNLKVALWQQMQILFDLKK